MNIAYLILVFFVLVVYFSFFFFFFQAEDGIRDATVTGVQTCALPISMELGLKLWSSGKKPSAKRFQPTRASFTMVGEITVTKEIETSWTRVGVTVLRSEERRVGKECRSRW